MASTTNVTLELAEQAKATERLRKLVAKRTQMLEAAIAEKERVDWKVLRRTEILEEHEALLAEAIERQDELTAQVEAATTKKA